MEMFMEQLEKYRLEKNLTILEFCEISGLSRNMYYKLRKGTRNISFQKALDVLDHLGLEMEIL